MPICAIHELSIACHDKVNKCKYYKLYKQLKSKEQECQQAMDNYVQLDLQRVKEYNELVDLYKAKEQACEELKKYKKVADKLAGMQVILTNEEKMPMLYENAKDLKLKQLSKILTEIKEIAENEIDSKEFMVIQYMLNGNIDNKNKVLKQILQKISEVENE